MVLQSDVPEDRREFGVDEGELFLLPRMTFTFGQLRVVFDCGERSAGGVGRDGKALAVSVEKKRSAQSATRRRKGRSRRLTVGSPEVEPR